ncbi:MAG: hypothetical protein ACRDAM_03885 [Casimicrobium sp.]
MSDIVRKRGDTWSDVFFVTDPSNNNAPVDIAGCSFLLTVATEKEPVDDTKKLFQMSGAIVNPSALGKVAFSISDAEADRIGNFFFDLQMTDANGKKRTIDSGKYKFTQDITKQ